MAGESIAYNSWGMPHNAGQCGKSEWKEPEELGIVVAHACNPGIKAEAGGLLQVQDWADYLVRPCLKKQAS